MPKAKGDPRDQLYDRLIPEPNSGCLLWTGCVCWKGYGRVKIGGRKGPVVGAHQLAWELQRGPISGGLCILHKCDVPSCCNVEHMRLGTIAENNADMVAKGRNNKQRTCWGETHGMAKITDEDVRTIRASTEKRGTLARQFGLNPNSIYQIRNHLTWKHVT